MSQSDADVRATVKRVAASQHFDTDRSLDAVLQRHHTRASARRLGVVVVAVVAVVLIGLAAWVAGQNAAQRPQPAPPPGPGVPNPFTLVRTLSPSTLSIGRVLRVAVGPDNHLYVTSRAQTISEVTPEGKVVRTWGRPGDGPGELRLEGGSLAVGQDGRVYVSDTGNARVQVFSATGTYLDQIGGYGHGPGQLVWPADVAVDSRGGIYVADDQARAISRFAASGELDWRVGHGETSDPDLNGHFHFTGVDEAGRLVAANDDAGKVVWISPSGDKVDVLGTGESGYRSGGTGLSSGDFPDGACDTAAGPGSFVYVLSCQDRSAPEHRVQIFDSSQRLVGRWDDSPFATAPVFLADGTAVVVGGDGSILEFEVGLSGG